MLRPLNYFGYFLLTRAWHDDGVSMGASWKKLLTPPGCTLPHSLAGFLVVLSSQVSSLSDLIGPTYNI
jgi:hypothetical protein